MAASVVLLLCAIGLASGLEDLSDSVDEAMDDLRWVLESKREIVIPPTNGYLRCGPGRVGLLDTLTRTGPVTVTSPSTSANVSRVTLTGSFGLETLYLRWDECFISSRFKAFLRQPVNITVANNSMTLQVTVEHRASSGPGNANEEGCTIHLDRAVVDRFSGVKVTTYHGLWYSLEDRLIAWTVRLVEKTLARRIAATVLDRINKAVGGKDVCSPFKPF